MLLKIYGSSFDLRNVSYCILNLFQELKWRSEYLGSCYKIEN